MNVSELKAFLNGEQSGREFRMNIDDEVAAWTKRFLERGRSATITLRGESETYDVTPVRAARLLDALLTGQLSAAAFAYVLDALLMSEIFDWPNDRVRDSLEAVLDPVRGGQIDGRRAWSARAELSRMGAK